jgi:hypothetical protein
MRGLVFLIEPRHGHEYCSTNLTINLAYVQTHLAITNLDQWRSKTVGKLHSFFFVLQHTKPNPRNVNQHILLIWVNQPKTSITHI